MVGQILGLPTPLYTISEYCNSSLISLLVTVFPIHMPGSQWIGKFCAEGKDLGYNTLEKVVDFAAATTGAVASK